MGGYNVDTMRTTIDLRDDQRAALERIALDRGLRGISELVGEAVDRFLADLEHEKAEQRRARRNAVRQARAELLRLSEEERLQRLNLMQSAYGSVSDETAERMHEAVRRTREHWRSEPERDV